MSAPAEPDERHSRLGRAGLLALLALALVLASGCARGTGGSQTAKLAWDAAALKRALPAVVLVRGRDLCVQRLDSATATPIWTAPAGTTPSILAVDQPGGRIAVALHAPQDPSLTGNNRLFFPCTWRDAGIEVLSADGMARRFTVRTQDSHPRTDPNDASTAETVPDVVTSGAFAGTGLLLTTRPGVGYRFGGGTSQPLTLSSDGRTSSLSVEGTRSVPISFVELPDGRSATVWGNARVGSLIGLTESRGATLRPDSELFHPTQNAFGIGTATGPDSLSVIANDLHLARLFVATRRDSGWDVQPGPGLPRTREYEGHDYGPEATVGTPQAGPIAGLLVPLRTEDAQPARRGLGEQADLVLQPLSSESASARATQVTVEWADESGVPTWTYLARFGH